MMNYNAIFLNTLEYLKIQKMNLIPNTLFNEDDVKEDIGVVMRKIKAVENKYISGKEKNNEKLC